jgi:hypothetical protein
MVNPLPALSGISNWVDPRRQALLGLASGLVGGNTLHEGLSTGFARAAQGKQADDAYATAKRDEQKRADQLNYTIQAFQKAGRQDLVDMANAGMMGEAWNQFNKKTTDDAPSNVREWEYFNALPDDATKAEYLRMKRANPYLDLGTGFGQPDPTNPGQLGGPIIPKNGDVPTGFQQTGPGQIEPMPGSEPDIERQGKRVKAESAINTLEQKNAVAVSAIDAALDQVSWATTGNVMGNMGGVPVVGQGAHDLGKTLDTIKANIGFEELQTMRDNSPTGGALGQVTERELAFLQSTIANIEQSQSEDQLKKNLKTLRDFIASSQERRRAAYLQQYGSDGAAPSGGAGDIDSILGGYGL